LISTHYIAAAHDPAGFTGGSAAPQNFPAARSPHSAAIAGYSLLFSSGVTGDRQHIRIVRVFRNFSKILVVLQQKPHLTFVDFTDILYLASIKNIILPSIHIK